MADEKTNPTPKVSEGGTDTMHSTPDVPDRSKMSPEELAAENQPPAPKTDSAGSERPTQETIGPVPARKTDEGLGTLVTDIRPMDENQEAAPPVNPGSQPDRPVAQQPGESLDDAGKRITKETKAADKASSSSSSKSSGSKATAAAGKK